MNIKILGSGCAKCKKLEANAQEAVQSLGIDAVIEKVQDVQGIMSYGVMSTPALVIDEEVKSSGKLLSVKEIEKFL